MKKLTIIFSAVALSGCVNAALYRENQPVLATYTTTKSVQDTQECILDAWQHTPLLTTIGTQKIGKFHSVNAAADNADVLTDGGVTRINFYSLRGVLDVTNGIEKRKAGIKSCL